LKLEQNQLLFKVLIELTTNIVMSPMICSQ
jgi:hypothetical protein